MTREERIKLAIEKGYTCNPITGEVFGIKRRVITNKSLDGYIHIQIGNNEKYYIIKAHQFIYYCVHKQVVDCIDHINGIKNDNRIENLRSVTKQQNSFNTKAKGYSWHKLHKKWLSQIMINGKKITIGRFNTEQEASSAYQDAKKIYHI
jgi:hypothetical protein